MYNMKNKQTGITLIALVITIIVLLILAGISIATLTGDNGVLVRATDAKNMAKIEEEKESIKLAYNSAVIEKLEYEANDISTADFDKEIKAYDNGAYTIVEGSKIIVAFSNGHKYAINKKRKG